MVLACETYGHCDVFVGADLRAWLSPDTLRRNLRTLFSADCPRRLANSMHDQCGALLLDASRNGTSGR